MKDSINQKKQTNPVDSFVLVSSQFLNRLEEKIDNIQSKLDGETKPSGINGFYSEKQAMELYERSHTWFWEKRKSGLLKFSKVGKTIYYRHEDLQSLIQSEI